MKKIQDFVDNLTTYQRGELRSTHEVPAGIHSTLSKISGVPLDRCVKLGKILAYITPGKHPSFATAAAIAANEIDPENKKRTIQDIRFLSAVTEHDDCRRAQAVETVVRMCNGCVSPASVVAAWNHDDDEIRKKFAQEFYNQRGVYSDTV